MEHITAIPVSMTPSSFDAKNEEKNGIGKQLETKSSLFPAAQLSTRIRCMLEDQVPDKLAFSMNSDSRYEQFLREYELSDSDSLFVSLALAASFSPEILGELIQASLDKSWTSYTGGFLLKGSSVFCPTVRTAIFLLAGKDIEKRALYTTMYHPKHPLFVSGIIRAEAPAPSAVFLDYQIIFNDPFLGTILQGETPTLDREHAFPVKRSNSSHVLSDVILKDDTYVALSKLQKFAANMKKLWEINTASKVRNNFISIFSGDPGTGKSHAAEAIGNELGLPVYKVNFAQMVSKYIGETEKNLEKVFDRFDKQNCILFFDEAESIFSKRSEVKDSHDQHANNLQSYLLQKVEEFSGIIILATNVHNLTQYFDKAFQRRFRLLVEFEFPDYPERKKLWDRSLFPPFTFEAGLTEQLSKNYQLSGGSIYNVVSDAVIEALHRETHLIGFELLETALKDEFKKTGRKYEICTDEMVIVNPVRRFGPGYEQRRNF